MPWDKAGARRHTKKATTPEKQGRWSRIANAILKQSGDEGKAIRIANSKMATGGYLKQKVGNRDTKHGLLDLPVKTGAPMKKPKLRFFVGGFISARKKIAEGEAEAKAMGRGETTVKPPPEHPRDKQLREAEEKATKKYAKGGPVESKAMVRKEVNFFKEHGAPPSMIRHEQAELRNMKQGGTVRCRDGCAVRGKTRGRMI